MFRLHLSKFEPINNLKNGQRILGHDTKMTLFKYIKKEHSETLLNEGKFRIGTIHDYRNATKYGTEIGEINEGSMNLVFDAWEGREIELSSGIYEAALLRYCLDLKPGNPYLKNKIKFSKGSQIVANLNSTNGYLFCTTTEFNKIVMESFECDECIEIFNPPAFIKSLSKSIAKKAEFVREGLVNYTHRQQNYRVLKDFHPAMIKPIEYQHQKEHRIIWEPKTSDTIEPFIVECPEASEFCRKYTF